MTTTARCSVAARRARADDGVLSLEFALLVPLFFLLLLLLFSLVGAVRDVLVLQSAAREGARAAATHATASRVHAVVSDAVDGRSVSVTVSPRRARPGDLVTVRVRSHTQVGPVSTPLEASAVSVVEAGRR